MRTHPATSSTRPPSNGPFTASFKDQIRLEWNGVATAWGSDHWWRFVEQAAQSCNDHLVRLAHVETGHRVLDVGTGIGEPAVTAAYRVGPTGYVLGIDLAPRMIETGRRRIQRLKLANISFQEGDAESLDLAPRSFDAVLSRWTLMLFEDLDGTLSRLRDLLRPGGWLAAGLWGHPSRVPMIAVALDAAARSLDLEPPSPGDGPGHLWTRGCQALEDILQGVGFRQIHTEALELVFTFPSPQIAGEFISHMAGPLRLLLDHQPNADADRIQAAIAESFEPFRQADGTVRLANETLVVAGQNPPGEGDG